MRKKRKEEKATMTSASTSTRWADIVQGSDAEQETGEDMTVVQTMVDRFMELVKKEFNTKDDDDTGLEEALETVSKTEFVDQVPEGPDRDFVKQLSKAVLQAKDMNKSTKRIIGFYREELQKMMTVIKKQEQKPKKEEQQEQKPKEEDEEPEYVTFKCKYVSGNKVCGETFIMSHEHHKYLMSRGCKGRFCNDCMDKLNQKKSAAYY